MCGRYTLTTPPSVIAEHFQVPELPNFPPGSVALSGGP